VHDDGHRLGIGVLHLPDRGALDPLLGILDGVLQGRGGVAQRLHSDFQTGLVHHVEHDPHAFPLLAQQFADALALVAEVQGAGGGTLDPHLVLHVPGLDVVRLAEAAVVVDLVLGNDEDGDAARPRRIAFDPRQNGMDDVRGQIMIARGDEALRPRDEELAVGKALRRGLQGADVAARTGFGEAHRPAPFPGVHLIHILVFQLFRTETFDQATGAQG